MGRRSQYPIKRSHIVASILAYTQEHQKPPSLREVAADIEVSAATMHSYVDNLMREGLVEWKPRLHRSLRVTEKGRRLHESTPAVPF